MTAPLAGTDATEALRVRSAGLRRQRSLTIGGPLASVDITDEMGVQDATEVERTKIPVSIRHARGPPRIRKGPLTW